METENERDVGQRRDGDGCPVVARNDDRKLQRISWHVQPRFREQLIRMEVGTRVEVLLDDGRVVETVTRSAPWNFGGVDMAAALVALEGFSGGYSLTRVRPLGWAWSQRVPVAGGAS